MHPAARLARPPAAPAGKEGGGEALLGMLSHGAGRVALYGDSNCLDASYQRSNCDAMLLALLGWATGVRGGAAGGGGRGGGGGEKCGVRGAG